MFKLYKTLLDNEVWVEFHKNWWLHYIHCCGHTKLEPDSKLDSTRKLAIFCQIYNL